MSRRLKYIDIPNLEKDLVRAVTIALEEDIGPGDITAELIPAEQTATATIITREDCVVCGIAWVDEVFYQLDKSIEIDWQVNDGEFVEANTQLCSLKGNIRSLLTGERTALNFLQLLSGTATSSREFAKLAKGKKAHDLYPDKTIEVEVENIIELEQAISSGADVVMLDNFSAAQLADIENIEKNTSKYELSGNLAPNKLGALTNANIDYYSVGALTKNCSAIDLSLRLSLD